MSTRERRPAVDKWKEADKIIVHYLRPDHEGHITHKLLFDAACVEEVTTAIEGLTEQIKKDSEASDRLSSRVWWLNVVLAILTLVGTVFTAMSFFKTT